MRTYPVYCGCRASCECTAEDCSCGNCEHCLKKWGTREERLERFRYLNQRVRDYKKDVEELEIQGNSQGAALRRALADTYAAKADVLTNEWGEVV